MVSKIGKSGNLRVLVGTFFGNQGSQAMEGAHENPQWCRVRNIFENYLRSPLYPLFVSVWKEFTIVDTVVLYVDIYLWKPIEGGTHLSNFEWKDEFHFHAMNMKNNWYVTIKLNLHYCQKA